MRIHTTITLLVLCGLLLIAACKTMEMQQTAPPPPQIEEVSPVLPLNESRTPDDIKLVTAALIERLRGSTIAVENVSFAPARKHSAAETGFDYDGFTVQDIAFTGYEATLLEPGVAQATLEGLIVFKDVINRRTGVYFATQYTVTQTDITIEKSLMMGMPPDFPQVEAYFVPEKLLREAKDLRTYVDYYLFAIENAEPMTYGGDVEKIGPNQKYFIMIFCKDRLFQESTMEVKITDKPYLKGKELAKPVYISDSGWRIAIAGGKFKPGSISSKFYVGVSYNLDPDSTLPSVLIGDFRNVKEDINTVR